MLMGDQGGLGGLGKGHLCSKYDLIFFWRGGEGLEPPLNGTPDHIQYVIENTSCSCIIAHLKVKTLEAHFNG